MLKERNFVWQVMNSRVHATCQQAGPSQQRAVSLVVVNWHFVVTFRLAAGRVACLRLLPDLSQAGSTLLSTSCLLYQMVWGSTGALLGKQGALALGLALGRGADRCQVSVHTGSLSQHVGVFLSRMLSPGHGGDQPAPS